MTPRIHHVFGSHAQETLGILLAFKFTEWTINHSLARKTKKQERESEMLKQAGVQGQAEVQSQLKDRPHLASSDKPQRMPLESPSDQQLTLQDPSDYQD